MQINMKNLELTTEQLKTLAIMQHEGEPYFIIEDEDNSMAFSGDEKELRQEYADFLSECSEDESLDTTFVEWLCENGNEIEEYNEDDYKQRFMCLTDEEADEKATEYIKDSLWAFNASFIIEHSRLPYDAIGMVQSYQESKCESANDTIEGLIDDMDEFISDAISADGRGHFLNTYDGHEHEETINNQTFYIYRMN